MGKKRPAAKKPASPRKRPAASPKARPAAKDPPKAARPAESTPGPAAFGSAEPPGVVSSTAELVRRRLDDRDATTRRHQTRVTRGGWREVFIEALTECGIAAVAAEVAGVNRSHAFAVRVKDAEFATKWQEAMAIAGDAAEAEMRRRAIDGWNEPVFYEGRVCGTIRRYDGKLLLELVRAAKPNKYRQRKEVKNTTSEPTVTQGRSQSMYAELLAELGASEN